ncbi:MAG: hypothetical protein OES24_05840 [Acidimicrobiia bacterium]|nr:hypothetical protein [Acidimicrobiia bacterium]
MRKNPIHSCTAEARSLVDGEFVSTSRVVDSLLDLRSLASADRDLVELIDRTLGSIPGRSIAPNSWWLEALDTIDRHAGADGQGLQGCGFASATIAS